MRMGRHVEGGFEGRAGPLWHALKKEKRCLGEGLQRGTHKGSKSLTR